MTFRHHAARAVAALGTMERRVTRVLAELVPRPFAAAPERVGINALCVLVGLSVFVAGVPSEAIWPQQVSLAWGVLMTGGGAAALVGYWTTIRRPIPWAGSLERVGWLAIFLSSTPYGVRLIWVYGVIGIPVGAAFIVIGLIKGVRLLISSSTRNRLLAAADTPEAQEARDGDR